MSARPVRLGLLAPLSGVAAILGPEVVRAARLACAEVNAAGGVTGRPLELVVEDDGSLPESAVAAARRLVDDHHCAALVGNLLSHSRLAVAYRVAEPRRVPQLNFTFYEGSIQSRYFFNFAALPNQQIERMIPYMRAHAGPRMFFAGSSYEWPRGSIHAARAALAAAGGEAVGEEYLPIDPTATAVERLLDAVEAAAPDVFLPYFAGADQLTVLNRFTARGLKGRVAVATSYFDETAARLVAPAVREGIHASSTYFMGLDTAANRACLERLAALPEVNGLWPTGDGLLTTFGEGAWVCVKAFAAAANAAGGDDPEALVAALAQVAVETPQGRVTMHPEHHHATVNTCLARCRADGGFDILERFGPIAPEIPDRYRHQHIPRQATLEEEIRLQSRMLEQMGEAVLLVSATDHRVLYANPGAERLFGYARDELLGQPLARLDDAAADPTETSAGLIPILEQRGEWRGETRAARRDGTPLWCSVTVSTFSHPDHGEVWLCVGSDISARKQAEADLRVRHTAIESSINAVAMADLEGRLTYVNPAFVALWRLPDPAAAVGRSAVDFWSRPEAAQAVIEAVGREGSWRGELTARRHDGTTAELELSAHLVTDAADRPCCMMGSFMDISDRKAAERALEQERDFATGLLATAPVIVLLLDPQGRVVHANPYTERVTGYAPAELAGRDWFSDMLPAAHQKPVRAVFEHALAGGEVRGNINPVRARDGSEREVEWYAQVLRRDGRVSGVLAVGQDVTERLRDERALRDSQARLNLLVSATPASIYTCAATPPFKATYISPNIERLTGYRPEQFTADEDFWLANVHPEDRPRVLAGMPRVFETGSHEHEYRFRFADGGYRWVHDELRLVQDAAGTPLELVGYWIDVTERRQAEDRLRDSEARHRELVDHLHAGLVVHGPDTAIHYINPAAAAMLGLTRDQALGKTALDPGWQLLRDDGSPLSPAEFPVQRVLAGGRDLRNQVIGTRHPRSGTVTWALVNAYPRHDPQGGIAEVTVTFIDITRMKHSEEELARYRDRLEELVEQRTAEVVRQSSRNEAIVETAMDGFFTAGLDGHVRDCNEAFCRMLGYTADELLALTIRDIEAIETPEETRARIDRIIATGHDRFDTRHRRKDGRLIDVEVNVTLEDFGDERLFFAFVHDISARKRAESDLVRALEEAERANAAKSEFLSRMSHELRTPLNAVLGFAQLLKADAVQPLSPDQADNVDEILHAGSHLLEMVNEVLDLARIESGRLELTLEPMALAPTVDACVAQVRPLAEGRDITMVVDVDPTRRVQADATRLKQVLLNLLSNAVKYNREAGEVRVSCHPAEGERLWIGVADTGPGIPADALPHLFQPFERLQSAYSGVEGTGIGLALARRLVEAMGGTIGVDTEPGAGSTFWLQLDTATVAVAPADPPAPTPGPRRVLYIEDNRVNLRLMKMLAAAAGIELIEATSAESGLELAASERPQVILCDLNLPGMDGFEAVRRLKAGPATAHIPVVAVTGEAPDGDPGRAGFDAWLMKPFDLPRLQAVLGRLAATDSNIPDDVR